MSSSHYSTAARDHKSESCLPYSQGHCRLGDGFKSSHGGDGQDVHSNRLDSASSSPGSGPRSLVSDTRPRHGPREIPCRAWKAGTCAKGSRCRFLHDVDALKLRLESWSSNEQNQNPAGSSFPVPFLVQEGSSTSAAARLPRVEHSLVDAAHNRAQEAETAARVRTDAILREDGTKTIDQLVSGSLVTFSAGLDVPHLITGFETCTLRVGNLPLDVKEEEVFDLVRSHCSGVDHFHVVIKQPSDPGSEAHIITDITAGQVITSSLYGVKFQGETLVVEMSATDSLEGMNAANDESPEILTISWNVPSKRYVAEYVDVATANAKVRELDGLAYGGRRIKAEVNSPHDRSVLDPRPNAITIDNLPPSVTDEDVMGFARSVSVERLPIGGVLGFMYPVEYIAKMVRDDIKLAVPRGFKKFDAPSDTCTMDGVVSARAHFYSWHEAHVAYTRLLGLRYGNQSARLRLPDPMYFTLDIPVEQYRAQKAQWNELLSSIKDRNACALSVQESGRVVHIQLSGWIKEATGALKVRAENLARGIKVEGWHRSLGVPGNSLVSRVHSETGAYLRADRKQQSLRVYGTSRAVDRAREMIKRELDRLASLDYTVTLARRSVGFFVREGIQQLKETLGENNVRFAMSSRRITVSGSEEARHALDRLVTHSDKGNAHRNVSQGSQTCPVCYDSVSSPHQLGCGHAYCVACLRHFFSSAVDSDLLPLTCIGDEARCRVPITIPTIQQFLPPGSFNRLLEVAFDTYIAKHPKEFKHCKTPDCTQIYRTAQAGTTPRTLQCPSCFSMVCNGCHEDGHDGMSCAESKAGRDPAEQERLTDAWIASQGGRVKKCPQCNIPIEKLEGCNHMTCQCGAHVCWRCMQVFAAGTIYDHMHTAHGTIHDDVDVDVLADPEPPIDIVDMGIPVDTPEQQGGEELERRERRRGEQRLLRGDEERRRTRQECTVM